MAHLRVWRWRALGKGICKGFGEGFGGVCWGGGGGRQDGQGCLDCAWVRRDLRGEVRVVEIK